MTIPTCELSAGKTHDENPPEAVVEVVLEWDTSDGKRMRRIKNLCPPCYKDKVEETLEHAHNGEHSRLTIQTRYAEGIVGPAKGRSIGRTVEKGRS